MNTEYIWFLGSARYAKISVLNAIDFSEMVEESGIKCTNMILYGRVAVVSHCETMEIL